jgi:hypothetical protein
MFVWLYFLFGAVPTVAVVVSTASAASVGWQQLGLPTLTSGVLCASAVGLTAWGWIELRKIARFHRSEYCRPEPQSQRLDGTTADG